MLSPIMFLFALSATAICEATVGVERGPDQEYQPIKSLASAAAERLLRSDPLALTQERGIPNLDRVLKEIFGALKAELKRNLVKSLQQMIGALPPSRAKQYLDFGSSKSGFKDADDAVTRFLLGHDYILSVAERFDYAHPGREFEAGLLAVRKFRGELDLQRRCFGEMWYPAEPEGDEGKFVRHFRELHKWFEEEMMRILSSSKRHGFMRLSEELNYVCSKWGMEKIGATLGEPSLANVSGCDLRSYRTHLDLIRNTVPVCWEEWKEFIRDLDGLVEDFVAFKIRKNNSRR